MKGAADNASSGIGSGAPSGTPKLGVVISMFPELHETFILRELVALRRHGVELEIFSLQRPRDPVTIDDAIRLMHERTHYSGLFTVATLGALARAFARRPGRVLASIGRVLIDGRDRPREALKNVAVLPIALHFGELGARRGITHWHGHWANVPSTACWYLGRLGSKPDGNPDEWHGDDPDRSPPRFSAAIHGEDIFTPNRFLATKLDAAAFTVVCSGLFRQHLAQGIGLSFPERVHLNYHGLDPRIIEHPAARGTGAAGFAAELATDDDARRPRRLVSIGRLVPTKGHDVLLRALAELRRPGGGDGEVALDLIGSGPLERELRELALELGVDDAVRFRGALAFADVIESLVAADVFVLAPRLLPGHPPDGIPNVIAEAMALGLPVVTTRVSAIPELVEDGASGRLVPVDDATAFAAAVRSVLDDPEQAARLRRGARARVAKLFDQDANIAELLALFDRHVPGRALERRARS